MDGYGRGSSNHRTNRFNMVLVPLIVEFCEYWIPYAGYFLEPMFLVSGPNTTFGSNIAKHWGKAEISAESHIVNTNTCFYRRKLPLCFGSVVSSRSWSSCGNSSDTYGCTLVSIGADHTLKAYLYSSHHNTDIVKKFPCDIVPVAACPVSLIHP